MVIVELQNILRYIVIIVTAPIAIVLLFLFIAMLIIFGPLVATIRWAYIGNETWFESYRCICESFLKDE